ncbi:DUF3883 domain-containing protein [Planococcus lenghuensis]|uniref:Uncharacterized protein n=1 Tax=Planococcus lenghuensis TaxID=2213202 RepID=A0A1Q2L4G9_9BACL|nr:DUF3883 domain-containing protein [Planococcus lenghuensis]AQQ55311.1 hypothetical protein B0X71_19240 [Planococcus lenghuensis]
MYNSLEQVIHKFSDEFLLEAKNSPQLFSDMAAMETYMAESYGERVFIEMLQNADDARATTFYITERNGHVFIANNGKPFDEIDVKSICRSGASEKKRGETIGYRGVGFKSTTHLSNTIYIHSNECTFSFSKSLAAINLEVKDEKQVPTIRIPFLVDSVEDEIQETLVDLKRKGFTTIFVFYKARKEILLQEVDLIDADYFLFLRNIRNVNIDVANYKMNSEIEKVKENVSIQFNGKRYLWQVVEGENAQIAFALNSNGEITPCLKEQAVFHCYLPTYEPSPYLFKINSDFSTDPSRKHITLDIRTENAIKDSAFILFEKLKKAVNYQDSNLIDLLEILRQKNTFAKIPRYFEQQFLALIKSNWIMMKNRSLIAPSDYIKKASFLDDSEWNWIRQNTPLKETLPIVDGNALSVLDTYLKDFAKETYSIDEWIKMLSNEAFVRALPDPLLVKTYANVLKQVRNKSLITHEKFDLNNCIVQSDGKVLRMVDSNKSTLAEFVRKLEKHLVSGEVKWLQELFGVENNELQEEGIKSVSSGLMNDSTSQFDASKKGLTSEPKKRVVSRWRAAEKQCIEFEEMQGNEAKDVSKQNLGYDVLSVTPEGIERYIEVKFVKARGTKISMTNNEYTSAHIHGENYFVCIIYEDSENLVFEYIQNPLVNLDLEKVVRQWEWICEDYNGQTFKIGYE